MAKKFSPNHTRFSSVKWFEEALNTRVYVLGAGGTGSWTTLFLNRIGVKTVVYDFDILEVYNLAGQFFQSSQIGKTKIEALRENVLAMTGENIVGFEEAFTKDSIKTDEAEYLILFSCFDNMKARREAFEAFKAFTQKQKSKKSILIDLRLSIETLQILCVKEENLDMYEANYLFSDEEADEEICSLKQTTHTAAIIAGTAVSFFTNHLSNLPNVIEESKDPVKRAVPFFSQTRIMFNHKTDIYE